VPRQAAAPIARPPGLHYPGTFPWRSYASEKPTAALAQLLLVLGKVAWDLTPFQAAKRLLALRGGCQPIGSCCICNKQVERKLETAVEHGVACGRNWLDLELLESFAAARPEPVRLMVRFHAGDRVPPPTSTSAPGPPRQQVSAVDPDQLEAVLQTLVGCSWARASKGFTRQLAPRSSELQARARDDLGRRDGLSPSPFARFRWPSLHDLTWADGLGSRYVSGVHPRRFSLGCRALKTVNRRPRQ